jgi:hypothetical protein
VLGGTRILKKIYVKEDKPVTLVRTTSWLVSSSVRLCRVCRVCRVCDVCGCVSDDCVCQDLVLRLADEFYNLIANDQRLRDLVIQPVLTDGASNRLSLRPVQFTPEGRAPFNETLTLVPGQYRLDFLCLLSASLAPADSIAPLRCTFVAVDGAL